MFVCFVIVRFPKPRHPLSCSWYGWKGPWWDWVHWGGFTMFRLIVHCTILSVQIIMLSKLGCALCNIGRSLMSSVLWRWFCNFSTQVVGNLELRIYVKILFIFVENWISALHLKNKYIIPFQNSFSITICDNNTRHTGNILKMGKLTLCENLLKRITNSKSPCQATTMMQWYWYCHNYGWVLEGIHVQCWN